MMEEEAKVREGRWLPRARRVHSLLYVRRERAKANGQRTKYCLEHRCVRTSCVSTTNENGLGDLRRAKVGLTRCDMWIAAGWNFPTQRKPGCVGRRPCRFFGRAAWRRWLSWKTGVRPVCHRDSPPGFPP